MNKPHPHATAIDRIGTAVLMDFFAISRQAVSYWRRKGVPKQYRKALILLGQSRDLPMPEMAERGAKPQKVSSASST